MYILTIYGTFLGIQMEWLSNWIWKNHSLFVQCLKWHQILQYPWPTIAITVEKTQTRAVKSWTNHCSNCWIDPKSKTELIHITLNIHLVPQRSASNYCSTASLALLRTSVCWFLCTQSFYFHKWISLVYTEIRPVLLTELLSIRRLYLQTNPIWKRIHRNTFCTFCTIPTVLPWMGIYVGSLWYCFLHHCKSKFLPEI